MSILCKNANKYISSITKKNHHMKMDSRNPFFLTSITSDIARIQKELELLEDHIINWPNPTAGPFLDCSTIRDCTDKILSRRTAVLHLISDRINISEGKKITNGI